MFVNRALARDHGYEPEELLGKSAGMLVSADENAENLAEVSQALRIGEKVIPTQKFEPSLRYDRS